MRLWTLGRRLCLALGLLLVSCRTSSPPSIEICLGDGTGGGNCISREGVKFYRVPSELQNYWMTNQDDMKAFSSWCYQTSPENTAAFMKLLKEKADDQ